ncbi:transglutaminase-like domain-containing protein [Jatrophihabitans sp. GAS493]|uniref:transglutaminase-like domain-containing protein n=1 Tax=Jatrophihabitans sp. GAS493 TaxID=1907575 RepID=UPI0012FD50AD|nr:transglutaminase-like domain-containing protein [Jatrophihabitans sp. GAS493]
MSRRSEGGALARGERAASSRRSLVPRSRDYVDAAFVLALTTVATVTLRLTFSGWSFLVAGFVGALIGVAIAHLGNALRVPWVLTPALLAVGYFLFGGVVALGGDPAGGPLPTPATVQELWRLLIHGWTQLLTTLAPVTANGPLIVLPFAVCLFSAGVGMTIAGRTLRVGAPLVGPVAALFTAILLGTTQPSTIEFVSLVFGALAVGWVALRGQRRIVQTHGGWSSRLATAIGLLVVASAVVLVGGSLLPGHRYDQRETLRAHVTPPVDLSAFPSPLVGFRKYRPSAQQLADQTLFTIKGLPAGYPIRIATLDDYNGVVWAAHNAPPTPALGDESATFQRVGSSIATTESGPRAKLEVTIGAAYAAATDTNSWLPSAGATEQVSFSGPDADSHAEELRYNLATDSAIVVDRVKAGDTYTLDAVLPQNTLPSQATPFGGSTLDPGVGAFVVAAMNRWVPSAGSAWDRLTAIANYLRTNGFYSEGGPGETQYLPGHSTGRLTRFLSPGGAVSLVGDDEQYAATFALMANELGIPARVVLGATGEPDANSGAGGVTVVRGKDVHAWVEVHLASGAWAMVPQTTFMPPVSKKPNKQNQQQFENNNASVVPPPNTSRPPSSLDEFGQAGSNSFRRSQHDTTLAKRWHLPAFVVTTLKWVLPPVTVVLGIAGLIIAVKALRRRRRRRAGTPALRYAQGWREILDQARDLGVAVYAGYTRREQAERLSAFGVRPLAERADGILFGPQPASSAESAEYWSDVLRARQDMVLGVSRWHRLRARVSLRSLRPMTRLPKPD